VTQYLYVICEADRTPLTPVKIGFSATPEKRVGQLQTAHYGGKLILFHKEEVDDLQVRALERIIHKTLRHLKKSGEWFQISPEDAVLEIKHAIIRFGDVENLHFQLNAGTIP
jgi:hypothetical protein